MSVSIRTSSFSKQMTDGNRSNSEVEDDRGALAVGIVGLSGRVFFFFVGIDSHAFAELEEGGAGQTTRKLADTLRCRQVRQCSEHLVDVAVDKDGAGDSR